ncbi:hypothetical protein COLO4_32935 [Corchorus olitorius]|uniref:Uncharacterized protein n=1 Tax=Corchorus olitorius TaxID=93759 RepID=A0A1R3GXH4_9ROSI|nr:hypothetical protein COLO4_32935 [Corchorus olitorius]
MADLESGTLQRFPLSSPTKVASIHLELHVSASSRFQHQINGLIGTKQNPGSSHVNVELSGVLMEDFRGEIRDIDEE